MINEAKAQYLKKAKSQIKYNNNNKNIQSQINLKATQAVE